MTEYLLLIPFLFVMGYLIVAHYTTKSFNLTRSLILLGVADIAYLACAILLHADKWYVPLIQTGISGLFFVLTVGVLGNKVSGATLVSVMAVLALIPSPFLFWCLITIAVMILGLIIVYGVKHRKEFTSLLYSTAVGAPNMNYDFLPEHEEALLQSETHIFVPTWVSAGALIGVGITSAFTLLA